MPGFKLAMAAATALAAFSAAPARAAAPADEIAAAERAFAAMASERGMRAAFLTYVAEDAVAIVPKVESARARWARQPDRQGPPYLKWFPIWTGAAASGDLGFSLGPWVFGENEAYGYYFSIWRRQADGSWKWVLDQGSPLDGPTSHAPDAPVAHAAMPEQSAEDSFTAFAEAARADDELNVAVTAGDRAAVSEVLAEDVRTLGFAPLAVGRTAATAQLAGRPAASRAGRLGGFVSKAGDLAVTYGEMTVAAKGREDSVYVRVWRREGAAWRVLFDELVSRNRPG